MMPLAFPFPCNSIPIESWNGRGSRYPFWSLGGSVQIHLPSPTTGITLKAGGSGAKESTALSKRNSEPRMAMPAAAAADEARKVRRCMVARLRERNRTPSKLTRKADESKQTPWTLGSALLQRGREEFRADEL